MRKRTADSNVCLFRSESPPWLASAHESAEGEARSDPHPRHKGMGLVEVEKTLYSHR